MVSQLRRLTLPTWAASLVIAWAAPAPAAEWPVARGPSREPVPYRYDPKQVRKLPKAFLEDAAACNLYSGITYLVEADGTVETITHEIVRFNGRRGIEKLGEYRNISYDPAYQKLTLNEARVLKANGQRVEIGPTNVQLRDLSTDYQVYDHDKQLIISFPNLEVGDAIEVKWTARGKNPEYQGQFFTRYNFGDDQYPAALDEMRFRLPRDRTLKYATVNGKLKPTIREAGDYRLYHWRVTNRPALPQDDNLPSREELRLQVVCSTFACWEEVGKWKQKLRADCWKCSQEIRKVVQKITRGLKTPEEKARALTYWIRRHVRYVSLGATTHDYKPHPPANVLANRFGDCKDQAQLLAVMLKEAGLHVGLVTLGAKDDGQVVSEVPSPWGSHAILLVTIDGKEHWIDTTVSNAPWDYLPDDDRDRLTYVTDDKGLRLKRTPALTADANRFEQTTLVKVAADGSTRNRRQAVYSGLAAVHQRGVWAEVPPGERRRLMTSELQDSNSRARLRRLAVNEDRLKNLDQDVVASLDFEIPGQFSGSPELEGSFTDSKVWGKLLGYTLDYDRQTPLDLGNPFESVHRYVIELPPALRFESLPKNQSVRSRWGSFHLTVRPDKKNPRRFALEFRTRLEKARVKARDFGRFRKFHGEVSQHWRAWLNLKPTRDLQDAPAMTVGLYLNPGDAVSAAILARLFCDNDLFRDARRVLDWARTFHPDNAELWELTVRAAPGLAEEEIAYQEMIRRFPKDLKYAVALAATRVKRGNYAGAVKVLEPITRTASGTVCANAHYQLARSCFAQGQPTRALEHFDKAARTDAETVNSVAAWQFRGQVCEKLGRPKDAAQAYGKALKVDAEAGAPLRALIRLELDAGRKRQALDYLRRYTVVVNDDLQGMVRAADFHLRLGRYDDALDLATRALDIRFDVKAERILGLVYLQRGDHDKAAAALAKAQKTPAVWEGLIRANLALGKVREAIRQGETARKTDKPTAGLRKVLALIDTWKGRRETLAREVKIPADKAEAWAAALDALVGAEYAHSQGQPAREVEKLLARAFPGGVALAPAFSLRGLLALDRGRLVKALADADKALGLSRQDPRAYYVRGRVRFERGTDGALTDLSRAAELTRRKDASILHALAAALCQAQRRDEALAAQREAVKLRPGDPEMVEQLRQMEHARR
jgi:tetratricopeptide (TPR) repeat protein/transglutaminase-like putative cysteine protease